MISSPGYILNLKKEEFHYVDLYHQYKLSPDTFYYGTDTHWNKKGVDKALHLVLEKMNEFNSLAYLHQSKKEQAKTITK